jgi:hypothetical protein
MLRSGKDQAARQRRIGMAGDSEADADGSADCVAVVADIAIPGRKLADTEPYQSMSGADALRALASYLDRMAGPPDPGAVVGVTVRPRRKTGEP